MIELNEGKIYFANLKRALKCFLLREHEYYIWKFVVLMRKEEKAKNIMSKAYYRIRKNKLGCKLGFFIPSGVFGSGLHIWHFGNIVINDGARVGCNCILHGDNCIGNNGKNNENPIIGDNVDIGVGAKIIGNVQIADNIVIAAGAVVVNSFLEPGITIGGVPAKKIKYTEKN